MQSTQLSALVFHINTGFFLTSLFKKRNCYLILDKYQTKILLCTFVQKLFFYYKTL